MPISNYKSDLLNVKRTAYKYSNPQGLIDILVRTKQSFYIRQTADLTSLVVGDKEFLYPSKRLFKVQHLFIFQAARKDVRQYLKTNPDFKAPLANPTNKTHYKYDDSYGTITGTDINGAYWRIALMEGFISQKTYTQGEKPEKGMKVARLAALSTLGTKRSYDRWENGEKVETVVVREDNEQMREVYKAIRYTCYHYMQELANMLGDDFEAWRTDCIYYRDTPENRYLVHSYLDLLGFSYKQLKYKPKEDPTEPGIEDKQN